MEVHHHSHASEPGIHRGRKKITHYIWEFLMLFLAVFCGFLAENIREHNVEKKKGEQYILSFSEDLKKDTIQCDLSIAELTETMSVLQKLVPCFNTLKENIHTTGCLKEIVFYSRGFKDFIYTDRTIQQLKNAGGLRLIEDKEIADSIIDYDAMVREMQIHQGVLENLQQINNNAHKSMIDFIHLDELSRKGQTDTLFFLSNDIAELNKYFNSISEFRRGLFGQLNWMSLIKDKAIRLLELLHKKGYK
jgi:hypothetical protein